MALVSSVIAPLDGSMHAIAALATARVLAELSAAPLHLVNISEPIVPPHVLLRNLQLTRDQLRGSVIRQISGAPGHRIVELASESPRAVIVMCTHTSATTIDDGLGSVARTVLRHAPCPVVLVRPELGGGPSALRRIVVPQDGTPTMAAALRPTIELLMDSGAEVDILHVVAPDAGPSLEAGSLCAPRYLDQPQHEWPDWTREFLDRTRSLWSCPRSEQIRIHLRTGQPGPEIVRFADERQADLIVLAWRGVIDADRATTLMAVLRHAPAPTMVLRSS